MAAPYGDINSPYFSFAADLRDINSIYDTQLENINYGVDQVVPSESVLSGTSDEYITPTSEQDASVQEPSYGAGGLFNELLGAGVDIYNPQSIAESLMSKYGVEGLTAGMFPAMSKKLISSAQASTYDPYKRMLSQPESRKYRDVVESSAGVLNPNKMRQRAMRAHKLGISDITADIFGRTSAASLGIRNWLSNALAKVRRMKY